MTQEEKAKRYDEAIKIAEKINNEQRAQPFNIMTIVFPELKESEDERIRKWLISTLKSLNSTAVQIDGAYEMMLPAIAWLEKQGKEEYALKSFKNEDVRKFVQYIEKQAKAYEFNLPNRGYDIYAFAKDILAWLEKQDEQNPADKVEPKFHKGDWVVDEDNNCVYQIKAVIENVTSGKFSYDLMEGGYFPSTKKNYHLWTIQDAKDGDVLAAHECLVLFKKLDGLNIKCYCTYHFMNNPSFYVDTLQNKDAFHPAIKEQRDILMKAIADAGYTFNFEKKELNKIEQKPANKVEPKFHEGDWLIYENGSIYYVNKVYEHTYELVIDNGDKPRIPHELIDKKARLWTIQDAKDGDVFYDGHKACIFRKTLKDDDAIWINVHCGINMDEKFTVDNEDELWCLACVCTPATKEQRDTLMKAMTDAGWEFDFGKKELKKIEQPKLTEFEDAIKDMMNNYRDAIDDNDATVEEVKERAAYLLSLIPCKPVWSEEDEEMLNQVIEDIVKLAGPYVCYHKDVNWLKSLKDRVQPQNRYAYNPYKAVVESIAEMCKHYDKASHSGLRDFYDNVKVKCKDAKEYDSLYSQSQWKPSDEQMKGLLWVLENCAERAGSSKMLSLANSIYDELKKIK